MLRLRKLRLFVAFFTVLSTCGFQDSGAEIHGLLDRLKMLFMDNVVADEGVFFCL